MDRTVCVLIGPIGFVEIAQCNAEIGLVARVKLSVDRYLRYFHRGIARGSKREVPKYRAEVGLMS